MALNKYNNLLTSERWYTKDTKDAHILSIFWVSQNIIDESKKTLDNLKRESKNSEPEYIRDIQPWMLEYLKGGVGQKNKDGK